MMIQMAQLRKAVEERRNFIIRRLIAAGYNKMTDGRQFYELTLSDLERLYIHVSCKKARSKALIQVM